MSSTVLIIALTALAAGGWYNAYRYYRLTLHWWDQYLQIADKVAETAKVADQLREAVRRYHRERDT